MPTEVDIVPLDDMKFVKSLRALLKEAPLIDTLRITHTCKLGTIDTSQLKLDPFRYHAPDPVVGILSTPPLNLLGFCADQAAHTRYLDWFSYERRDDVHEGYSVRMVGAYMYTKIGLCKALWPHDEALAVLGPEPCRHIDTALDEPKMVDWDMSKGPPSPRRAGRKDDRIP